MKKKLILACLVVVLFAACKQGNPTSFDLTTVKSAIAESNKAYGESFASADSAKFINSFTTDGCIMPANAPKLCGAEALGMFFKGAITMGVKNIVLTTEDVMGGPEFVIETGTYNLQGDANLSLDNGKFIVVWKIEEGKWKMFRDIFTTNLPVAVN